jgi:hypothetical protein
MEMGAFRQGAENKTDEELLTAAVLNGMLVRTRQDGIKMNLNLRVALKELRELRRQVRTLQISVVIILLIILTSLRQPSWLFSWF